MAKDLKPGEQLPAATLAQMREKLDAKRRNIAAGVPQTGTAARGGAVNPSTAGDAPAAQFHGNPGDLVIGRNNANTVANTNTCGTGSTLAEPAAANEGPNIYYTGNLRHQEFSTNGGPTWTCAAAYPAGPAAAPIAFGDTDVIYDHSRGVTFHSVLYVNAAVTDGVIGIFVRRNIRRPTTVPISSTSTPLRPSFQITQSSRSATTSCISTQTGSARRGSAPPSSG